MRRLALVALVAVGLGSVAGAQQTSAPQPEFATTAFESYIELLRQQAGIPAISGALIQDGTVVWERGLGLANVEARVRATPDTPYPIADLSQTFAAVLLLQCVELRRLDLDVPVAEYGVVLPDTGATLRQLLNHTPPPAAGVSFRYDPSRYAALTAAMEHCVRQPYRRSIVHRLLDHLAMIDSVPGRDLQNPLAVPDGLLEPEALTRYGRALERLAVPYRVDSRRRASRTELPPEGINAAVGLVSTVRDLARFDAALDAGVLLRPETLAAAWSPAVYPNGIAHPAGLGWFVQTYRGTPVVWQFGVVPNAYSALIVKVPSRQATMILLANSDGLTGPFQMAAGDVTRSLFASIFLRMLL
jgi:CubicO group peptidase (beta-lactamase class C family)